MKEAGVHVGHDIVTIAGNRAGTMLVQVTIPALLGAQRKSGRGQWSPRHKLGLSLYANLRVIEPVTLDTNTYVHVKKLHIIPPCWEKVRVWL